jgi:hypothetical protein
MRRDLWRQVATEQKREEVLGQYHVAVGSAIVINRGEETLCEGSDLLRALTKVLKGDPRHPQEADPPRLQEVDPRHPQA